MLDQGHAVYTPEDPFYRIVAMPEAGQNAMRGEVLLTVLILVTEEQEITEDEWLRAAAANAVFDFLQNPAEDIYTLDSRSFRPHEDVSDSTIAS